MTSHIHTEKTFLDGVKDCLPTLIGYLSIGFAFGVVGIASHLSIFEIFLLSLLIYAGAAQFIFCSLLMAGTPASAIILTTFIVNLRHFLMSLSLAPSFKQDSFMKNIGYGTLLTDETYGVAMTMRARQQTLSGRWMDGLNVTAYISWIIASIAGAIVGKWIPNPESWGLDFALTAMFVALLILNLQSIPKSKLMHYVRLILYMGIAMFVLMSFLPSHLAVLASTLVVAAIGVMTEK
ncbi:AzlC family ABC transporter permease [Kurthia massiliensis]|uniref:AzlC family ABC transporter permease n=1 Tax=Kurthia massiliensis TaxID=1033739 RepID=UPI0002880459|nr:AzlC family ABC transporter permease [Kurthia massiliensis]